MHILGTYGHFQTKYKVSMSNPVARWVCTDSVIIPPNLMLTEMLNKYINLKNQKYHLFIVKEARPMLPHLTQLLILPMLFNGEEVLEYDQAKIERKSNCHERMKNHS